MIKHSACVDCCDNIGSDSETKLMHYYFTNWLFRTAVDLLKDFLKKVIDKRDINMVISK